MKSGPTSLGTFALIATAALWGSNHVVARAAREAIPLPALVFWRWLPAAIVLTIVALPTLRPAWPGIRPRLGGLIVGGAVGVGLFSYLLLGGAYQSLAIEVGFINATTPVWVLLLGLRMGGAHLTAGMKWGLALAFAGTLLIISKGQLAGLHRASFQPRQFMVVVGRDFLCLVFDPGPRLDPHHRAAGADGGDGLVRSDRGDVTRLCGLDHQWRTMAGLA